MILRFNSQLQDINKQPTKESAVKKTCFSKITEHVTKVQQYTDLPNNHYFLAWKGIWLGNPTHEFTVTLDVLGSMLDSHILGNLCWTLVIDRFGMYVFQ